MLDKTTVLFDTINSLYMGMSQLAVSSPMGDKHYLEIVTEHLAERTLEKYREFFTPASDSAIDVCQAWINLLDKTGYLDGRDYCVTRENEKIEISVNKTNCTYRDFCSEAKQKGLPHTCPRMVSCKWIASRQSGEQYQFQLEAVNETNCSGYIYPRQSLNEILSRDGDKITIAGERAIVLSTNAFGILLQTIYKRVPELLGQVLYESAYYSGLMDYEKVSKYYHNCRDIIEHLLNTVNLLGNIRYEIIKYDEENMEAEIRGYDSYSAEIFEKYHLFKAPKVSCYSACGRLSAYFSKAWQTEITCEEMECEVLGDNYCTFILLPKES